jgi:hypothetical protein
VFGWLSLGCLVWMSVRLDLTVVEAGKTSPPCGRLEREVCGR